MSYKARPVSIAILAFLLTTALVGFPVLCQAQTRRLEVDFSRPIGTIRPLNGVNGGPIVTRGAFDLSPYFREIGVKHIRLHDVPWYYENAVDINYVFPRDTADVDDPQNYDFSLTDYYLKSIVALGAEMTFRLGYSAEWPYHPPIHNVPPKDFAKWAAVCAHIVRHYNQGWDNGFHYNIKYWEIWNEPDISMFWTGTPAEYFKLYELTARGIKQLDPHLKVGGPTLASYLKFLDGFLQYCRDHDVPLDFVSWHRYASRPQDIVSKAAAIQALLDKYGFSKAESVLDEWNYFPGDWEKQKADPKYRRDLFAQQMGGSPGAAFDASTLIYLQDSTVAVADFYQGTNLFWGGLFDAYGNPAKPFFTLKAFKFLLATPQRVFTAGSDQTGFAAIAGLASDSSEATILVSNFGSQVSHFDVSLRGLPWKAPFTCETYVVDLHHDLDRVKSEQLSDSSFSQDVEVPSVCLIRLRPGP